jgi:hypothetical protein
LTITGTLHMVCILFLSEDSLLLFFSPFLLFSLSPLFFLFYVPFANFFVIVSF